MNNRHYKLDGHKVVPCTGGVLEWAKAFEIQNRKVAREKIGDSEISTVFLGLDHGWERDKPPILWETMVFGGKLDQEQDRCSGTWEQAESMHAKMVQRVKESA